MLYYDSLIIVASLDIATHIVWNDNKLEIRTFRLLLYLYRKKIPDVFKKELILIKCHETNIFP